MKSWGTSVLFLHLFWKKSHWKLEIMGCIPTWGHSFLCSRHMVNIIEWSDNARWHLWDHCSRCENAYSCHCKFMFLSHEKLGRVPKKFLYLCRCISYIRQKVLKHQEKTHRHYSGRLFYSCHPSNSVKVFLKAKTVNSVMLLNIQDSKQQKTFTH